MICGLHPSKAYMVCKVDVWRTWPASKFVVHLVVGNCGRDQGNRRGVIS